MSVETKYKEVSSPIRQVVVDRNKESTYGTWNVGLLEERGDDVFFHATRGSGSEACNGVMMTVEDALVFFEEGIRFARQIRDKA